MLFSKKKKKLKGLACPILMPQLLLSFLARVSWKSRF
jgi:hypothetical protein